MSKTSMVISKETRAKLATLGNKADTFEDIIKRLIEEHEKIQPRQNESFDAWIERLATQRGKAK